jgi:hypothetical protein
MPPVGHLQRARSACAGRLGIGAGPVPTDHLDAGRNPADPGPGGGVVWGRRLRGRRPEPPQQPALWHPRSVLAAAGLPAIDSPYFDLRNADGLRREADEAAELGYLGKVAIHPRQLPVIEESFRPTAQELATARAVVAAADAADGEITTVDGHMVGWPLIAAARALTARAGAVTASTTVTEHAVSRVPQGFRRISEDRIRESVGLGLEDFVGIVGTVIEHRPRP